MRWLRIAERSVPVFLPVLTAVIGALWAVHVFVAEQRRAAEAIAQHAAENAATIARQAADTAQTRLIEAQKPFLDKQLELYARASKAAGILASLDKDGPDKSTWMTAKREFLSLFWGELPTVENSAVETAMVNLRDAVEGYNTVRDPKSEVAKRAYCLGHAIRQSIQEGWKVSVGAGEIPQQVFENDVAPSPGGSPPAAAKADCTSAVRTKG
jgi:hypothetical protein